MKKALIIIDVQNEYSITGGLPVIRFEQIVSKINNIKTENYDLIVSVRHINNLGLFSKQWNIAYPESYQVDFKHEIIKQTADCFDVQKFEQLLLNNQINQLDICGMMTQNCITYTALTAKQRGYHVNILSDICSTIDQNVHTIALRALSTKVTVC